MRPLGIRWTWPSHRKHHWLSSANGVCDGLDMSIELTVIGRIPKDMLYGELVTRTCTAGLSYLRYRCTCKRDMKVAGIDTTTWEAAADDRGHWRSVVKTGMRRREKNISVHEAVKSDKRKQKSSHPAHPPQPITTFATNVAEIVMPECG